VENKLSLSPETFPNCKVPIDGGLKIIAVHVCRCPTTDTLGLVLYSVDRLTWGFSFHMPKFTGRDELFVVCDALICDRSASKLDCDRSCILQPVPQTTETPARRRRLAQPTHHHDFPVRDNIIGAQLYTFVHTNVINLHYIFGNYYRRY